MINGQMTPLLPSSKDVLAQYRSDATLVERLNASTAHQETIQEDPRSSACHSNLIFFSTNGLRVGMVPRSSLKEGKNSLMEKGTRINQKTQT